MKTTLLFWFCCLFFAPVSAQQLDSLPPAPTIDTLAPAVINPKAKSEKLSASTIVPTDSLPVKYSRKPGFATKLLGKKYPSPRLAALFSAVLPGAGQAYNKKWWKVPVAWGALGAIGYFTFKTQNTYRELRDNYKLLVDEDPNTNPTEPPYNTFDATRTKSYRDTFRGYTEKWYLALGVTYLLVVTDAFVDAHLYKFDVSDDLSLRFKPSFETSNGAPVFGMGIALSLSNKPPVRP